MANRFRRLRLFRSCVHLTCLRVNAHLHKSLVGDGVVNWFNQLATYVLSLLIQPEMNGREFEFVRDVIQRR